MNDGQNIGKMFSDKILAKLKSGMGFGVDCGIISRYCSLRGEYYFSAIDGSII
jgi:hypothetical protein